MLAARVAIRDMKTYPVAGEGDGEGRVRAPTGNEIAAGEAILSVENVSLSFGGVKAITDVSFDIRKGEIRAIIGPNGAGKTSMLNVINGFYTPQHGRITFKGETRSKMRPHEAASGGIARTFQNVALFRGMTALDNIMAGPLAARCTAASSGSCCATARRWREEVEHRRRVEDIIEFLEIAHIRKVPVGVLPYGLQKRVELGRALAMEPDLLLLDEPMAGMNLEEKEDMSRYMHRREQFLRHHDRADRARHGRGDGSLRPRGRARLRPQDRRRHARRGQARQGGDRRLSRRGALREICDEHDAGRVAGVCPGPARASEG